jgi:putative endonuclease
MREGRFYKFWVYIMASRTGTLYTGMTGFVDTRIFQHKSGEIEGFTKQYKCTRLVYFEQYDDVYVAKRREKQLKGWRKEKKIAVMVQLEQYGKESMTVFIKTDRHPELPSMRARRLQRPNRGEGPFVLAGKHKVSQGYSPADLPILAKKRARMGALKTRGSLTPFEMTLGKWFE